MTFTSSFLRDVVCKLVFDIDVACNMTFIKKGFDVSVTNSSSLARLAFRLQTALHRSYSRN